MVCDTGLEVILIPEKPDLEYISKYQTLICELILLCVGPQACQMANSLGVLVRSVLHSKQNNFIRLPIRVGMMFYLLENRPTLLRFSESELISTTYCTTKVAFLRKLVQELGFVEVSPTIIFEVNNGAIAIGNSGHLKKRISKHIDLYFSFLSDYISREFFKFERVDTKLHLQHNHNVHG